MAPRDRDHPVHTSPNIWGAYLRAAVFLLSEIYLNRLSHYGEGDELVPQEVAATFLHGIV